MVHAEPKRDGQRGRVIARLRSACGRRNEDRPELRHARRAHCRRNPVVLRRLGSYRRPRCRPSRAESALALRSSGAARRIRVAEPEVRWTAVSEPQPAAHHSGWCACAWRGAARCRPTQGRAGGLACAPSTNQRRPLVGCARASRSLSSGARARGSGHLAGCPHPPSRGEPTPLRPTLPRT
eukprot:scaffold1987_cov377-Prasinococcus_capsulatus_cf.AAC.4